jgi:ferredoxin
MAMAMADKRREWGVDDRCIGCGASVTVAPELIVWDGDRVRFARQPSNAAEEDAAWRAALVCPTGSIKRSGGGSPPKSYFPKEIVHGVFRCGFNARASYGAHSYFVQRSEGNLLIDSPRYIRRLESFFEEHGEIAAVLLTHRDDVCDADRYPQNSGRGYGFMRRIGVLRRSRVCSTELHPKMRKTLHDLASELNFRFRLHHL